MLSRNPSPAALISRRRVLVDGGYGLLALALLGTTATACGSSTPPAPDPLEAQVDAARHDSDLATAAAKAAAPAVAPALKVVAAERARHAAALAEEIARAAGKPAPTPTEETSSPTSTTSAPAAPPPTVADVVAALRSSADSATQLTPTLSGYRAGLVGSIAAACTTAYSVALPSGGRPQ